MSDLDWEAEDFEPVAPKVTDKWEGEDEEDNVKENWDDEERVEDPNKESRPIPITKKKKKLPEIIAEKEARKAEELERKRKEKEESDNKAQSPEDELADKVKLQKIQEDSDLQLASELVGEKPVAVEETALDTFDLSTMESLEEFRIALVNKIRSVDRLERRPFFVQFVEDLSRDLTQNFEVDDLKKISAVINAVYNEKVKACKPIKGKKKAASKAKLNTGQGAIADDVNHDFGYDEYDDFI